VTSFIVDPGSVAEPAATRTAGPFLP